MNDVVQKSVELRFDVNEENQQVLHVKINRNEPGLIYRITGVLFVYDLNILSATAATDHEGNVDDSFTITGLADNRLNDELLKKIEDDLEDLLCKKTSMFDYLADYPHKLDTLKNFSADDNTTVQIEPLAEENSAQLTIQTPDRAGLLFDISQVLFLYSFDILEIQSSFKENQIIDVIKIQAENKNLLEEEALNKMRLTMLKEI